MLIRLGAGAVALAAAAVLLLPAVSRDGGSAVPSTPVAQAAERTAEYPGARMRVVGQFSSPSVGLNMTFSGEGAYNGETGRAHVRLEAGNLPSQISARLPGGRLVIDEYAEQSAGKFVLFMRSPALLGQLPDGVEWVKIDLSDELAGLSQTPDPREQLELLRDASADFRALGSERIRGVKTTHYAGRFDQQALIDRLRDEGDDEAADLLERAAAGGVGSIEMEVWVGPDATVHRMQMSTPFGVGAVAGSMMVMTIDLFDFGIEPQIDLPRDEDAFDATELALKGLGQSS